MNAFYERNRIAIIKVIMITVFTLGMYLFVNYGFVYVAPFVFGYLFSLALTPLASLIHMKCKIQKGVASFLSILFLIVLIGLLGTGIISKILSEASAFTANVPYYLYDFTKAFEILLEKYNDLTLVIPDSYQNVLQDVSGAAISAATGLLSTGVRAGSVNVVSVIPGMLLGTLLSLISAYFFIRDRHIINDFFKNLTPPWLKKNFSLIKKGLLAALGGYYRAQLLIGLIVGTICMVGLMIMRYPYALFLGVIIIVLDSLPIFGCGTVFWPWIVFSLITGSYSRAVGLLIIYAIVFITRQMIEPRILGKQIGIHPLITLMSIYIGLKVFGLLGVVIGPVVIMTVKVILDSEINFWKEEHAS